MILISVLIFIFVCIIIFVFFTFINNSSNNNDKDSSNETLSTTLTLTGDKSYILQNLENLKTLIEERLNGVDLMSDQSTILGAIEDLESKIKAFLHDPITNLNTVKYSLVNLQQDIAKIITIINLYPTQNLKDLLTQLKNIQTELQTLIGKPKVSVSDVIEKIQNMFTNNKNEIIGHIPSENKITSFVEECKKISATNTERYDKIISLIETQGETLRRMIPTSTKNTD